ncbi:MAG: sugar transferase [Rivularia sp. (in: Bacteria)]|nr:sugar transferase [Rivularia sp. MS3]
MTEGIYILANDVVYDQLVALLNSIEVNAVKDYPVSIIPYNDRLERVREEIKNRSNVEIFADASAIKLWEDFSAQIWQAHPDAYKIWQEQGISGVYRLGMHRRFCGFDGAFDKFIYLDADILVLNSLDYIFEQLNQNDFVVYDFQYKDLSHVYNANSNQLRDIFSQSRLDSEIFCAGFYAANKGLFDAEKRKYLLSKLQAGEAEILYKNAPDQTILNYMVMRSEIPSYNFSNHLPENEITGCCVTSPHFNEQDNLVYDKGNRLTYLHYIGLSSKLFSRVCSGENIDFPYRETFLHYRYLHEPDKRPIFTTKPKAYNAPPSLTKRVLKKLGLKVGA